MSQARMKLGSFQAGAQTQHCFGNALVILPLFWCEALISVFGGHGGPPGMILRFEDITGF